MPGNFKRYVMRHGRWLIGPVLFFVAMATLEAQEEPGYIRFVPGGAEWEGELQTAVVSFENDTGVQLNLVAAVHLGEQAYYAALNDFFTTQDVVLYELVAEPDEVPLRGSRGSGSLIGFIQQAMAEFLGIGFQLEEVDYSQTNFLHADLTPSQLDALMAGKNENFFTMFLNLVMAQMAEQNTASGRSPSSLTMLSLMNAMNSENQNDAVKFLFAEELGRSGGVIVGQELEQGLTLLGDRNRAALRVLREALQNPDFRQISIFYGAAHMPGIEREIAATLGFSRVGLAWRTAWKIP